MRNRFFRRIQTIKRTYPNEINAKLLTFISTKKLINTDWLWHILFGIKYFLRLQNHLLKIDVDISVLCVGDRSGVFPYRGNLEMCVCVGGGRGGGATV